VQPDHNPEVAIAIFDTHELAADAVQDLQRGGLDMKRLSIVGRDYHTDEHVIGYFNAGDRARFFGKYGAFWGALAGVLIGSAFLVVPVVGHLVILGPFATTVVGALEGAVIGGGVTRRPSRPTSICWSCTATRRCRSRRVTSSARGLRWRRSRRDDRRGRREHPPGTPRRWIAAMSDPPR